METNFMRKTFYGMLFVLLASVTLRAQSVKVDSIINEQRVHELVSTLSSDHMMGRKAFTPSVRKAADFISAQFKSIGLEPLGNVEDEYLQKFIVYTLSPRESNLHLNGNEIPSASYFVSSSYENLSWPELNELDVARINEDDDFRTKFSSIVNTLRDPAIVLVHQSHRQMFNRYKNYFSRSSRTLRVNQGPAVLFVLTNDTRIDQGAFSFIQDVKKEKAFNIAGKITGTTRKDEYVIFSAHYDHIGILKPVDGDSIANGADDNASGTTAVITLADYYKKKEPPARTLIFVAFTAEEIGGFGSRYFSKQLDPDQVAAMFNIEMIGKPSRFGPNTAFLTGFEKTDMGTILKNDLEDTPYQIYPDPYPEQNLFYRSDNATLARLGVPAHTISSVQIDKDQNYHTVNDELSTLNIEHLTNMIRAIALSSESIVSGSETPTRPDPATLN